MGKNYFGNITKIAEIVGQETKSAGLVFLFIIKPNIELIFWIL